MESISAKRHLMPLACGRARAMDGADAREAEAEPLQSGAERVNVTLHETTVVEGSVGVRNRLFAKTPSEA